MQTRKRQKNYEPDDLETIFKSLNIEEEVQPQQQYIGKGGYGITFVPAFPCLNGKRYKGIGKVFIDEGYAAEEWDISQKIKKIEKGTSQKYFTYPKEICYIDFQKSVELQPKLLDFYKTKFTEIPKELPQLIMDYSGMTIDYYIQTYYKNGIDRLSLLYLLENLFYGVKRLLDHGYVHQDIKTANIIVSNKMRLRLIDFGLMMDKNDFYENNWLIGAEYFYVCAPEYNMFFMDPYKLLDLGYDQVVNWYKKDSDPTFIDRLYAFTTNSNLDIRFGLMNATTVEQRIKYFKDHKIHEKVDLFSIGLLIVRLAIYLIPESTEPEPVVGLFVNLVCSLLRLDPNERITIDGALKYIRLVHDNTPDIFKKNKDPQEMSQFLSRFGKKRSKIEEINKDIAFLKC